MAYIEENLKIRSRPLEPVGDEAGPADPQEELYRVSERWKSDKKVADEGSVTNSLAMLTAIPEVDLGMECVSTANLYTRCSQLIGTPAHG
jgi:Hepatocellular carcinoma-associated antigen 59